MDESTELAVPDLDESAARDLVTAIKSNLQRAGEYLDKLRAGRGYLALGYDDFRSCVQAEFGLSDRESFRLLGQEHVLTELEGAAGLPRGSVEVGVRAAEEIRPNLADVVERVRSAVKGRPKAKRAGIVRNVVETIRAEERKPEQLQWHWEVPRQKEHYQRVFAWVRTCTADVLTANLEAKEIDELHEVVTRAYNQTRGSAPPAFRVRPLQKDCHHPINNRMGKMCGWCGKDPV